MKTKNILIAAFVFTIAQIAVTSFTQAHATGFSYGIIGTFSDGTVVEYVTGNYGTAYQIKQPDLSVCYSVAGSAIQCLSKGVQ